MFCKIYVSQNTTNENFVQDTTNKVQKIQNFEEEKNSKVQQLSHQ